ncbi:hypothetical protein BD626DRAFT_206668 [Schizophyllum amplum]|uniref:Uncharacterized protein n=1 Tax=Schizophyllum amplum TaxID=97359 RepID=A0A550BZ79_9AGAR|nr:hypothetical protein BD626DRAFT_206668 [Auriculariopsis ampla]
MRRIGTYPEMYSIIAPVSSISHCAVVLNLNVFVRQRERLVKEPDPCIRHKWEKSSEVRDLRCCSRIGRWRLLNPQYDRSRIEKVQKRISELLKDRNLVGPAVHDGMQQHLQ